MRALVDESLPIAIAGTSDKALRYQQNLVAIGIGVVLITGVRNRMHDLRPIIPRVLAALAIVQKGQLIEVRG